ncbi:MAG: sulfotransferase [bacterium]|nr:sulfotransferase [bacterium]
MNKRLYFLAGLPRSGSTVLAAILNQHPEVYVSPTSGLMGVLGSVIHGWENNLAIDAGGRNKEEIYSLLRPLIDAKYQSIDKPVVIDKSRGWAAPRVMQTMEEALGEPPKIIATVRTVPDCAASFVRVAKPTDVKQFLRTSGLITDTLRSSYVTLKDGFEAKPQNFCFVDYDEFLADPQHHLDRIHDFLGLAPHTYNLEAIEVSIVAEHDEKAWGIKGLHDIKPKLERQHNEDSREVLGDMYNTFLQDPFWEGGQRPTRPPQLIDLQRDANLHGDFDKGWEIAQILETHSPNDDRAAFNRGWHLCHQGKLVDGLRLLDRGRGEGIFGNPNPGTGATPWDGVSKGTVLLNLEAGLGDQIHGVRFARDIARRGSKVIVAGSPELIPLFTQVEGVTAACAKDAGPMVYHDYWVPSMSVSIPLGLEYAYVDGSAYIPQPPREGSPGKKYRIGLRWQGNPKIEDDVFRTFPSKLLFDAVYRKDVEFISLQRDKGAEQRPDWAAEVPLDDWRQTARAIASCDLVVTSCTSVAHLSGAMGVPTWIVIPVMPYYLWALPGKKTPWYESVTLYRQTVFGEWEAPFKEIKKDLTELLASGLKERRRTMNE